MGEKNSVRFSEILRMLLTRHDMTLEQLGEKLGVTRQAVSGYCTGKAIPHALILLQIAEIFNVSVDYLLTGNNPENRITREELGLSERALEVLKSIAQGETLEGLSRYLDSLICDKDFREALYAAIGELQRNAIGYHRAKAIYDSEDKTLDFNDFMNLIETRATQTLQAPLQGYFKSVNLGRKAYGDTPNEYFGETISGWVGDKPVNALTNG